jgi:thiol-disulfide isomerase/thioredoxin
MEENLLPPRRFSTHQILGTLGFVLALTLICVFSWRVFAFYRDIRSGEINPALGYTTTDFSRAATAFAARAAASGESSGEILGENDPTLGSDDAKIVLVEFGDFGCSYSREVAPIVRAIVKQYPNDIQFMYRDYPIDDLHPGASLAAEGGGCAQEQGKFWEYYDAVFGMSDELSVATLTSIAETIGMDTEQFERCVESGYYANDVADDTSDGANAGVVGTPTFFFNGQKVEGSIPFTIFNQIVDAMRST